LGNVVDRKALAHLDYFLGAASEAVLHGLRRQWANNPKPHCAGNQPAQVQKEKQPASCDAI
jgi:hypothetical protein